MTRILRVAILAVAATGILAAVPTIVAANRGTSNLVSVTVDVSAYAGRTLELFAGRAGRLSPLVLPDGSRVVVPFDGTVQSLGEFRVTGPRLTLAVDASIAETLRPRVAVVPRSALSSGLGGSRMGRMPVARMVPSIDQEPAPN